MLRDVFRFEPTADLDGVVRGCVVQCRLSGYIVALPRTNKRLLIVLTRMGSTGSASGAEGMGKRRTHGSVLPDSFKVFACPL